MESEATRKLIIALVVIAVIAVGVYYAWKYTARSAYESAAYTVVESSGNLEIREYPELMVATTSAGNIVKGDDSSFLRLFRYIDGGNEQSQKIAMTTPVFMNQKESEASGQMSFVLPQKLTEQTVPTPNNQAVKIEKRTGGRFAVIRFKGRMNQKTVAKAERELRQWLDHKGLEASENSERAGYDPPWTPGPLRRNEVLIRLK